jgi:hypothetical protein
VNFAAVDVKVLRLQPGDMVVLTVADNISWEQTIQLRSAAEERFPDNDEIVVLNRVGIEIVRPEVAA